VPGAFKVGSETVAKIGVRYKGSFGAFVGCTTGGPLSPSGSKVCAKMSMKVSFDWADPAQRFHGLKKLNLHALNEDSSLMRDRLGYALFRDAGLAAPRCVHVRVMINGNFAGVFALVEEIDGRFTDSHFTSPGDGNLYKEIWPKWTAAETYRTALHTNKSDPTISFDRVQRFAQGVVDAADDAAVNKLADQWMDMPYVMTFIAADRTILNDDGIFHWYCNSTVPTGNNPGPCSSHNYFWYEEAHWDQLWLIEWDITLAFRGETNFTPILDPWDAPNPTCTPKAGASAIAPQQLPPSCDKLTHAWGARSAEYKAAVRRFLDGPYAASNVDAKLAAWTSQISGAVTEAANAGQGQNALIWQNAVNSLKSTIADLRSAAETRAQ
jgi:spore coat protein CotH